MENLTVDAKTEQLERAIQFIDEELAALDCPKMVTGQIELAVEEIFMNIVHYAYSGESGKIRICIKKPEEPYPKMISITIIDSGRPFNPLSIQDPATNLPLEEREIGGLGIFLVKKVMTSVSYAYKNGCNNLIMSKSW